MTAERGAPMTLLLVLCVGCGSEPQPSERPGVETEIVVADGIERLVIRGEAERWTLVESLRLGHIGGNPVESPDEFSFVSSVGLGPDGLLYVADLHRHRISVFDTLGNLRRVIGRQGQGPGEFEGLFSIAWVGDHLLTLDIGNARLEVLSPDDERLEQRPASGSLTASPVTFRLYAVGPSEVYQWGYETRDSILEPVWWPHGPSGRGPAIDRATPLVESDLPDKVVCTMGRGFSWFDHPFAVRALTHPGPGGHTFVARTDSYEITVLGPDGDTVRVITRIVPDPPLLDSQWDPLAARFAVWLEDKEPANCQPPELERPESQPILASLLVDAIGRLWVERNLATGTLWEVFDQTGHLIGAVPGFHHDRQRSVPWFSETMAVWVTTDSLDVPYVHLGRIQP